MDLLADENQHPLVVERLRIAGHRVEWILETSPGMSDEAILSRPDIQRLVLLTYDRDFGDLIFNRGYAHPRSILYTRLNRLAAGEIADRLVAVLEAGVPAGHMITITKDGNRAKPFPIGASHG